VLKGIEMKLQVIDNDVNYWVVRAGENAKYYEHFRHNGIVALGHIDELSVDEGIIREISAVDLTSAFTAINTPTDEEESETDEGVPTASQIGANVTQAARFINEIKVGDIIITVNKKRVSLGTVKSEAYIERSDLRFFKPDGNLHSRALKYKLRRKVEWEPAKLRASMPSPIKPSLSAHQTLFSISEANQELYGVFQKNDKLYFSTKIDERDKISQFNVTEFQRAIQKIELLAEQIANNNFVNSDDLNAILDEQYRLSGMHGEFTLTTKNSFLSPGNIWNEVSGGELKQVIFAMILGVLFNQNVEASEDVVVTPSQVIAIEIAANNIKDGDFEYLRESIKATLDSPNKSLRVVTPDALSDKEVIVFPRVNVEGDTGI
jgi:predicted Mrr-cat superfamily restriction endonuclease